MVSPSELTCHPPLSRELHLQGLGFFLSIFLFPFLFLSIFPFIPLLKFTSQHQRKSQMSQPFQFLLPWVLVWICSTKGLMLHWSRWSQKIREKGKLNGTPLWWPGVSLGSSCPQQDAATQTQTRWWIKHKSSLFPPHIFLACWVFSCPRKLWQLHLRLLLFHFSWRFFLLSNQGGFVLSSRFLTKIPARCQSSIPAKLISPLCPAGNEQSLGLELLLIHFPGRNW